MKRFVQYAPRFDTCLKILDRAGGKAVLASERARTIISKLIEEGEQSPFDIGRLTGHGEGRVHNCLKYNLGNGYRLICLLKGNVCTLAYAGSHDDCDRWIRRQHSMVARRKLHRTATVAERRVSPHSSKEQSIEEERDDYEASLAERLQETDIMRIFNCLCKRG